MERSATDPMIGKQRGVASEGLHSTGRVGIEPLCAGPAHAEEQIGAGEVIPTKQTVNVKMPFKQGLESRAMSESALAPPVVLPTLQLKPKVIEDYEHHPGARPRKVLVERTRREYIAMDMAELLSERGVSFADPELHAGCWMPLTMFDDREYDTRKPQQWIDLGGALDPTAPPPNTAAQVLLKKLNREMQQEGLTPAAVYESVGGGKEILPKLFGQLLRLVDAKLSDADVDRLWKFADEDSSGALDVKEFIALFTERATIKVEWKPVDATCVRAGDVPASGGATGVGNFLVGAWEECSVQSYDDDAQLFAVTYADGAEDKVDRLQILFLGEDPVQHADRVAAAVEKRRQAQTRAKFNFTIDNMPVDEIPTLDVDRVGRILDRARCTKALRSHDLELVVDEVVKEVNLDFGRTMNKIAFNTGVSNMKKTEGSKDAAGEDELTHRVRELLKNLNVQVPEDEMKLCLDGQLQGTREDVPYSALVDCPPYNFTASFSDVCFAALCIQPTVISTIVTVREMCLQLLDDLCMYPTKFDRAVRVESFRGTLKTHATQTCAKIREAWITSLQKLILQRFSTIGSGWFNTQETSTDTYAYGKLKKFLRMVRCLLQDTIRDLGVASANLYAKRLLSFVSDTLEVKDLHTIERTFNPEPEERPKAIWILDVKCKEEMVETRIPQFREATKDEIKEMKKNKVKRSSKDNTIEIEPIIRTDLVRSFIYAQEPETSVDAVLEGFDFGLMQLQDIPQLERLIVPQLFKTITGKQVLAAATPDEPWAQELRGKLERSFRANVAPLQDYLELLKPMLAKLELDHTKWLEEFNSEEAPAPVEQIKKEIDKNIADEQATLEAIPDSKQVGPIDLLLSEIKKQVAGKHTKIVEVGMELIMTRYRESAQDLVREFQSICTKLGKACANVEEVASMKEYMQALPSELAKLEAEIKSITRNFNMIEHFKCKMVADDVHQRWRCYAGPKNVQLALEKTHLELERAEKSFLEDMRTEQSEFAERISDLRETIVNFSQYNDIEKIDVYYDSVLFVNQKLKDSQGDAKLFNAREALFGVDLTDFTEINALQKQWEPFNQMWTITKQWLDKKGEWLEGSFSNVDAKDLENTVTAGTRNLFKVVKDLKQLPEEESVGVLKIAEDIKNQLEEFKPYAPLVVGLRNPGMRDRHWEQVSAVAGAEIHPSLESFTLSSMLALGLLDKVDELANIGDKSGKEFQIEKQLSAMKAGWEEVEFDCKETYRTTETYILKGSDEVANLLDEQIVVTQAMQFSPFKGPFQEDIEDWATKLMTVSETLENWLKVQKNWMYLQPIFDSADIIKQLPAEAKKFKSVDTLWRTMMGRLHKDGNSMRACLTEGLLEKWVQADRDLEQVQKGLEDYLETKRAGFARFYFLSNDELLEILSQAKDPTRVQPFLCKVFEAIDKLTFNEDNSVNEMVSKEGEALEFVETMHTEGKAVEVWMTTAELSMQECVRHAMEVGVTSYPTGKVADRPQWVLSNPGQIVLNGSQVHWTAEVEVDLPNGTISRYCTVLQEQLLGLVNKVRGKVTKLERTTIGALVVIDVHAKDVVEKIAEDGVCSNDSFEWISQLRYYWEVDDTGRENCWVRMVQTDFPYGNEYLGNSFRLVITPLTDKCYMTLMGAQNLNLGGAPAGPAGTGKTETTKDLAKALAKQCVVFNCSPEMDYIMVGKFFKGLASCGAWCCFDEFNRIYVEVLSVIAQQLLELFGAKADMSSFAEVKELEFEGTPIVMRPAFNVFITMNPGYAGRAELPDNLAALFRPMAMMVPDYAMIGEIMFYAFGFESGRGLARKMVTTFKLSSEQLSAQDHYDYGMRAVKTVIEAAGLNKRLFPNLDEDQILLRALRDVNVPKFLRDDLPLFENIILDLFPTTKVPVADLTEMTEGLKHTCTTLNCEPNEFMLKKCVELYDMIQVRHGMMLVGPTGGGKTKCLKILQGGLCYLKANYSASSDTYQTVVIRTLNPKAITQAQLYGAFDPTTHEWSDGIGSEQVRAAVRCAQQPDLQWIMFDGPVDALWIESMNTVLDDNKKLCLVSGEIIGLTPQMRMQFEVEDLSVASPATVSRCGMIYLEPESLGNACLVNQWMKTFPETFEFAPKLLTELRERWDGFVERGIFFIRKRCREVSSTCDNNLVESLHRFMDCFFAVYHPTELKAKNAFKEEIAHLYKQIQPLFIFCYMWSIGGGLDTASRPKFAEYVWSALNGTAPTEMEADLVEYPPHCTHITREGLDLGALGEPVSPTGRVSTGPNLYEYYFDIAQGKWIKWIETVPTFAVPRGATYEAIIVPSSDSISQTYIFKTLTSGCKHVLNPGGTGTGKSANINLYLAKNAPDNYLNLTLNFSAQTQVNQLQDLIDSKVEKRRRGVYGPPSGKKLVIFVDDLNMPQKEFYGAQPPLELLRQWHDHRGWFNRKELAYFELIDFIMVSAMGPPGGGRTFITGRLKRHYNCVAYTDMSQASLTNIFETLSNHFLQTFSEEVTSLIPKMVQSSLEFFTASVDFLLPTPEKSHYLFNLRDVWRVFLGVCSLNARTSGEPATVVRCFLHEIDRVFGDRLIDDGDRTWVLEQQKQKLRDNFALDFDEVRGTADRLVFGSFMTQDVDARVYQEIDDIDKMKTMIEEYLDDYNNVFPYPMLLSMFLDACCHIGRITRVLQQPNGNCLLLGVGGSGRQSLTRLATHIQENELYQIEVIKGYGLNEFRDDLRTCLMRCGAENKVVVFLFCDAQIVNEQFVEAVNNVLNSGDVPNLYRMEDMDVIGEVGRPICAQLGLMPTKANVFTAYLSRVKKNIHVTLAFSPVGDDFRDRMRMFPSLVNCCTIDWFLPWPAEALYSVANQKMEQADLALPDLPAVLGMFQVVHQSVEHCADKFLVEARRHVYITPTSYLELLASFVTLLRRKRDENSRLVQRYGGGLQKIENAEEQVAGLQQELEVMKPVLAKTMIEVDEMMVVIAKDKEDAAVTQEAVAKEEEVATGKAKEANVIKADAQKDLDEALPALELAVQCLKKLKKEHITEVKSLANPPAGVRLTMEAVCIMFEVKPNKVADPAGGTKKVDDYWGPAKTEVLVDANKLLDRLMNYDKENIPDAVIKKIKPYIEREDFDPAAIKKASVACEAMCMWCGAMYKYNTVAKQVEPKRQMLRAAEEELAVVQARLREAQATLRSVNAKIAKLEADLNGAVAKKDKLVNDAATCEVKLVRADKLIGGLGGEKARWGQTVVDLNIAKDKLPGDCVVAAGMVSYCGPFTAEYRNEQLEKYWHTKMEEVNLIFTPHCSVRDVIGEEVLIQQWVAWSLPNDSLSVQNAIVMDNCRRWPLLIDPQRQAGKFLKLMGKQSSTSGIEMTKLSDKNMLRTMELGIQFGKWILLEDIGTTLDPALEPILLQQKTKDGSGWSIKLGDKTINYSDTFRFFMTTSLPNPHYSPETSVKVTLLNFAITPSGLEDQMLGLAVAKERPDLEEQKSQLVQQNAKMNRQLKDIEDEILKLLQSSEGNVLDDDTLVNTIAKAKETAVEINAKQAEAAITEKEIDVARESYRTLAFRAQLLFFGIVEFAAIDPMYQFSLQWFQQLFQLSVDQTPKSDVFEQRLQLLSDCFTELLYQAVSRGLFEKDKLLFSFAMCLRIMDGNQEVNNEELRFLLTGPTKDLTETGPAMPNLPWMSKAMWNECLTLSQIPTADGFYQAIEKDPAAWQVIYDSLTAHKETLPGEWDGKLSDMAKLCVLRCLRMDSVELKVVDFVTDHVGRKFVEPPTFDISKSFADSTCITPLILILSAGMDPTAEVLEFAGKKGMGSRFESIALGQGQGPKAQRMIESGTNLGGWVLLANCHLAISWLATLEMIVQQFNPEQVNSSFRLWLTSMPSKQFPVLVLQNGVKMTNEPPKGLRANLLRSYAGITDKLFAESNKPQVFHRLLFGFCFFHAVAQDRRKFGPIGWNIPYNFTSEDLITNRRQLMTFVNQYDDPPYKVLNYLGAAINYGGRVTDDKDKRLIEAILETYINPNLVQIDDYSLSVSGTYKCPVADNVAGYVEYIRTLPLDPAPEAFGMDSNCAITCAQNDSMKLLEGVLVVSSKGSGGGGGASKEEIMDGIAQTMQDKTPKMFEIDLVEKKYPTSYNESLNTVIKQECLRYNNLMAVMNSSLKEFRRALKGLVVMSSDLNALGTEMFNNAVPEKWGSKGFLSLRPLSSWVNDLIERVQFLNEWYEGGTPIVFWITGFFFPQAFITGVLQNYARKYQTPIDIVGVNLAICDTVKNPKTDVKSAPEEGAYVYGMSLEGARWSFTKHHLVQSRPKELYTDLPMLNLLPAPDRVPPKGVYNCPLYKVLTRRGVLLTTGHSTNFVMMLELPTVDDPNKWTIAGVAAVLALKT